MLLSMSKLNTEPFVIPNLYHWLPWEHKTMFHAVTEIDDWRLHKGLAKYYKLSFMWGTTSKNQSHYSLKIFMSMGFLQLQFENQIWFLSDFATLALSTRLMIKKNDSFTNWALLVFSLTCQDKPEQMSTFPVIESYRPLLWCFVSFLNHEKKNRPVCAFLLFRERQSHMVFAWGWVKDETNLTFEWSTTINDQKWNEIIL